MRFRMLTIIAVFPLCMQAQMPTASQVVGKMKLGWNLGNTLEAICGETAWGGAVTTQTLIDSVKAAGFNAVRIPCAWFCHSDTVTSTIDKDWMERVRTVVDYCIRDSLYVVLNMHWDKGWLENRINKANQPEVKQRLKKYWTQIAQAFKKYDEHLLFAGTNEPDVKDSVGMGVLMSYHQTFINAVRATGGNNRFRTLIVQGPGTDIDNTLRWMHALPVDVVKDRLGVEIHYYTPYQFTLMHEDASWGKIFYYWGKDYHSKTDTARNAIWGEERLMEEKLELIKQKFSDKGVPVIIGEFGAFKRKLPDGADQKLHELSVDHFQRLFVKTALSKGLIPFYWDVNNGLFDRSKGIVREKGTLEALRSYSYQPFFLREQLITSGIYYYPEHWKEDQWERDISKIAEMGFEFVHLAEFAWYKMEPQEGKFDFTWLDKVVDLCEKYNLKVVMCTPSATTPVWMRIKYPETFVMDGHYIRGENGTRGLGSITNSKFRSFVSRIVQELGRRYGKDSRIIGWQIDNEPPAYTDYSPSSQSAFRGWLKNKYKTITNLNKAWGTTFWSQWFTDFNEVIIPNTNLVGWWGNNPHALLDLKRYLADSQAEFLDFQADILRKNIIADQFVTTNYTAISTGADATRTKKLDFATYTAYPNGGSDNIGEVGFRLGNSNLVLFAAEYYKLNGGITGVMEMQPGPVNWGYYNPLLLPGTVRMWLFHSFAAGGRIACSYRFRQILYSSEQYHSGVIKTDGITPSPGGEEYVQFNKEIKQLRAEYESDAVMPAKLSARKTAIVWNLENFWTIDRQRQTYQWDTWNYPIKFLEIAKSFGAPVDIVDEKADLSSYKVVIVPAYEMVDPALVQKWTDYVQQGGQLVITCRTGVKDRMGHFWEGQTANPVATLAGITIIGTDMLSSYKNGDILMSGTHYSWNDWADLLVPRPGSEILAVYNDQFYKGKAAVVRREIGKGDVYYIGASTDDSKLEKDILKQAFTKAGAKVEDYPRGVYVYWRDGFYIAVNYSSENHQIKVPAGSKLIIGEDVIKPAGVLVWKESK